MLTKAGVNEASLGLENLPPLLTIREVQGILRLSRAMVYRMVEKGEIKSIRIGRAIRIPRDIFLQWLDDRLAGETHTPAQGKTGLHIVP